ncbi:pseudouridine synthase [Acinetobacter rudis]|uniref:Pseudouridine synthase n=1 Tax=Acinetobacter rudis TaxID=632955 RepID=A0AAW8J7E8_9GAMM|nr:pseudouridine synthase [Acinetobacter rudis]MDQ8935368.1 pseudouridine synthase [Acinetobacter rudis]MDQ8952322.1 pseudouridine synthase [Acinetobacter rudis]MDQ9017631.1 pseudouridine synthase [Acinetobacter rudis]
MPQSQSQRFIPPMREGVSASQVFLPQLSSLPTNLFSYLCDTFSHITVAEWQQRFTDGLIIDKQGQILKLDSPYLAEQHIYYYRYLNNEIHIPFYETILFENDDLLVVDKPHFLTISPTGQYLQETLLVRLKRQSNNAELSPIHRLDRETAGVVLFAKRAATRSCYQQLFAERLVEKSYHAIAPYQAHLNFPMQLALRMEKSEPFYTMRVAEGQANTETEIELIDHNNIWAKYLLKPKTGKQHQLRVHLNHLGIPIRNDHFYPIVQHQSADDFSHPLQLLAHQIQFTDPLTKQKQCFTSRQLLEI